MLTAKTEIDVSKAARRDDKISSRTSPIPRQSVLDKGAQIEARDLPLEGITAELQKPGEDKIVLWSAANQRN
jgi:hypothetical protein